METRESLDMDVEVVSRPGSRDDPGEIGLPAVQVAVKPNGPVVHLACVDVVVKVGFHLPVARGIEPNAVL